VPNRGLRYVGVGLLCIAFVRLALNPAVLEYHRRTATPILNWYLYGYGLPILFLFCGARLFRPPVQTPFDRIGPTLLNSLGAILSFLLLNIEIADYFSVGPTLTFSFSGNFARDMSYSIGWAFFAFVLLLVGMKQLAASTTPEDLVQNMESRVGQILQSGIWNGRGFLWGAVFIASRLPEIICRELGLSGGIWVSPLFETLLLISLAIIAARVHPNK